MNGADGNSGFGWMLVIGVLIIAGIGLIWILTRISRGWGGSGRTYPSTY